MVKCDGKKPDWLKELKEALAFALKDLGISKAKVCVAFLSNGKFGPQDGAFLHLGNQPQIIYIEKTLNRVKAIQALFHELAHWQQCERGAFDAEDEFTFEGVKYSCNGFAEYYNAPWEVEARSVALLLCHKWLEHKLLNS